MGNWLKNILLLFLILFCSAESLFAQGGGEASIQTKGIAFNGFIGFNKTTEAGERIGNVSNDFTRTGDVSGRFIMEVYATASYFIIPRHLSVGAGLGFSRSYRPNFNQVPFYLDMKGYIFQERSALYLWLQHTRSANFGEQFPKSYSIGFGVGGQFYVLNEYFSVEFGFKGRRASNTNGPILSADETVRASGWILVLGYKIN